LAGGRLSGNPNPNIVETFKPVIPEVDVYNFTSGTWSTLPPDQNIPTPRAAASVASLNGKLLVIGGEVENEPVYGAMVTDALVITEQYDPVAQTWTRLPDLNHKRHGTQAIVSGEGVFIVGGSHKKGAGNQKNMEFLGEDNPVGIPTKASQLSAPDVVDLKSGTSIDLNLRINAGTTGIIIRSMELAGPDASHYGIVSGNLENGFLMPDSKHTITVFLDESGQNTSVLLTIEYGATSSLDIVLKNGELSSGFDNPGTQYHKEGNVVSLPIELENAGGDFTFSATGLPPTLTIDPATGVISGTVTSGENTGPFLEENGLLIIEAESGNIVPGWTETTTDGVTGIKAGTNSLNSISGGTIPYQVTISTPGVYRFNWRSFFSGSSPSDQNDNWLRFPNNEDVWFFGYEGNPVDEASLVANLEGDQESIVFPKGSSRIGPGTTPLGGGSNGYFKIFRSGGVSETYDWQSRTSDAHDGDDPIHDIYVRFVNAGTYTFEVSERSAGHVIDKMALYKVDGPSYSDAVLTTAAESPRGTDTDSGAAAGSPYQVEVTVSNSNNIADTTTEEFTWIIDNSGAPVAGINASQVEGEAPLRVLFSSSPSADDVGITDYLWEFGDADGSTSDQEDVGFTFAEAGIYNVSLTVTDADGQTGSDSVEITVLPKPTHSIFATAGAKGSITPEGQITVDEGSEQAFSIIPDEGYLISDIQVDGVSQSITDNFIFEDVQEAHTITVSFEAIQHVITSSATNGGSIDPESATFVNEGSSMSYSIVAESGYRVNDVTVDGVSQGAISFYEFTEVNQAHGINAVFEEIPVYDITAGAGPGGTISPEGTINLLEGTLQTFSATANKGYSFEHFLVDGEEVNGQTVVDGQTVPANAEYSFENIMAAHSIEAVFIEITVPTTYIITASGSAGGTISPAGSVEVFDGGLQNFAITPDDGFEIGEVLVNGESIDDENVILTQSYAFEEVNQHHTIEVVFAEIIPNGAPSAVAVSDITESFAPLTVNFDGSDSTDDKGIVSYTWSFGDGSPDASGAAVSHIFTEPGVYTAILTVTDEAGESATDSIVITVNDLEPNVRIDEQDAELRLFPNPASIEINLGYTGVVDLENVYIYNMGGRLMRAFDANDIQFGRDYIINVSVFSEGFYFISAKDLDGNEYHKQMVIQRKF
ncbi:MAG: PKD domain-containing protein, partial [Pricia sp.]